MPREVTLAAVYLVSQEASLTTGRAINLNGKAMMYYRRESGS